MLSNTRLPLLEGKDTLISEIYERLKNKDKNIWVLSYNISNNSWIPVRVLSINSSLAKVYDITLDTGESVIATSMLKV